MDLITAELRVGSRTEEQWDLGRAITSVIRLTSPLNPTAILLMFIVLGLILYLDRQGRNSLLQWQTTSKEEEEICSEKEGQIGSIPRWRMTMVLWSLVGLGRTRNRSVQSVERAII